SLTPSRQPPTLFPYTTLFRSHVDCYRLRSPAEAQDLGFEDMVRDRAIVLIEWPERAGAWTPRLDRHFRLSYGEQPDVRELEEIRDRKSTRLNSSHLGISYAVF